MNLKSLSLLALSLLVAMPAMGATYYGTQATKPRSSPPQLESQGAVGGRLKVCNDSYTLTADLDAGDVIKMCKIPAGATVIDVRLAFPALGGSGTISVGHAAGASGVESASTAAFIYQASVNSAGVSSMFTSFAYRPGFQKTFAEEVQIQLLEEVGTTATSGTIWLEVLYLVD